MGAALLGGAGSVLFAGSAQAACSNGNTDILFSDWITTPIECDDKRYTYRGEALPSTDPLFTTARVRTTVTSTGTYLLNVDFADFIETPFSYDYTASIFKGLDTFFAAVDVSSDVDAFLPAEELSKIFYSDTWGGTEVASLLSTNGSEADAPVPPGLKTLYVSVDFDPKGGSMDSYQDSYKQTVPGPLPLLGAGMAFGFSRKLRSRIKARVQA